MSRPATVVLPFLAMALVLVLVAAVPRAGAVLTVTRGSDRDPEASQIVLAEDDGSQPRVLGPGTWSAVSPDGLQVAVLGYEFSTLSLYGAGGELEWELRGSEIGQVQWSPDSTMLVGADVGARRLLLVDAASGELRTIIRSATQITGESFSPDSTELAYTTRANARDPGGPLQVVDLSTGRARTLRASAEGPVWGPAGIAFSTISRAGHEVYPGDSDVWNVARINPDGSGYRQLSKVRLRDRFFGLHPIAWSRDGARIASGVVGADGEWLNTWVVNAVHGGAKLLAPRVEATAISSDGRYVIGQTGDVECCGFRNTDIVRIPWSRKEGKPRVLVHHAMFASSSADGVFAPEPPPATPTLPTPKIGTAPKPATASREALFSFSSSQPGAGFECKLSGHGVATSLAHWSPCTSPHRYSRLPAGDKRFYVRATNGAERSEAATWDWTILKPGAPKPLVIPTTKRRAAFRATCPLAVRCRERVAIEAGGQLLAHGRYSVPAHSSRHVLITLTGAGEQALAHRNQIAATLTIVNVRTHESVQLPVVLTRREAGQGGEPGFSRARRAGRARR